MEKDQDRNGKLKNRSAIEFAELSKAGQPMVDCIYHKYLYFLWIMKLDFNLRNLLCDKLIFKKKGGEGRLWDEIETPLIIIIFKLRTNRKRNKHKTDIRMQDKFL